MIYTVFILGVTFIIVKECKIMQWLSFVCCVLCCFGSAHKFKLCLQLQRNCLFILRSDKILQDVRFDTYRCVRLVMNCLCTFDDPTVNEMGVFICRKVGKLAAWILYKWWHQVILRSDFITQLESLTFRTVRPIYRTGTTLPSIHPVLYTFSTNIRTVFFKHSVHTLFFLFKMPYIS
jgi:hypothetical protein